MRQRELYAMPLIRVNTCFAKMYAMALTATISGTYALARSCQPAYAQGNVSTLGKNIERLRLSAGHANAARFARSIGITPATLNDWESGRYQNLRLDSLLRVARGVPCVIDELLIGVDTSYDEIVTARAASSYTPPALPVPDPKHEKNIESVTQSVPSDGVQSLLLVRKQYEQPSGGSHVESDAAVRPPLSIAIELADHVKELRSRADAIAAIADRIATRSTRSISPSAKPAPRRGRHPPRHGKRSAGRGGKH
jgi:DNA-binding transcriptional regulator YiaG